MTNTQDPDFITENRIYYHDTDCGGVVYYANYLKHLEEGRFLYLLKKGLNLAELSEKGVQFPVVRLELEYKAPARYADIIRIFTRIDKIGNSSIHFKQEIKKGELLLVRAMTVWACVNKEMHSMPLPEEARIKLLS